MKRIVSLFTTVFGNVTDHATEAPKHPDTLGIIQAGDFTPPPNRPGKSGYILLTHQHQENNLCVPTSASMALDYFGSPMSPREIKMVSRKLEYDPEKEFDDFTITLFPDLISGLSALGFTWQLQTYQNNKAGVRIGLAALKKSIDAGRPVLIDTSLYGGHTFVVAGYDGFAQKLIIVDPNIPAPGIRLIAYNDIADIWNSRGVQFDGRAAIFTAPNR